MMYEGCFAPASTSVWFQTLIFEFKLKLNTASGEVKTPTYALSIFSFSSRLGLRDLFKLIMIKVITYFIWVPVSIFQYLISLSDEQVIMSVSLIHKASRIPLL